MLICTKNVKLAKRKMRENVLRGVHTACKRIRRQKPIAISRLGKPVIWTLSPPPNNPAATFPVCFPSEMGYVVAVAL